jgi:hypothetical protein
MKFSGQTDYHGSRAYAPELPSTAGASWVKRLAVRLAAWAKQAFESSLRPGADQAVETIWLVHGNERHFSILGSERYKRPRAAVSPWPEGEVRRRRIADRTAGE